MNVLATIGILERILLAGHFDPANTNLYLAGVGIRAGRVCLRMALGLIQPVVQRISHIVRLLVAVGDNAPIGARLGFHAEHGINGRPDQRFNSRRQAALLGLAHHIRVELITVVVVTLAVGLHAPIRLILTFLHPLREGQQIQTTAIVFAFHLFLGMVFVFLDCHRGVQWLHGASPYVRQLGASLRLEPERMPGFGIPETKVMATLSPLSGLRPIASRISSLSRIWIAA